MVQKIRPVILKLIIVIFLIALGFGISQKINADKNNKKDNNEILGTTSVRDKEESIVATVKEEGNALLESIIKELESVTKNVVKTAGQEVSNVTSKSAETAKEYVFQNTVVEVIKQLDKLPEKQQEEIRKEICK